VKRKEDGFIFSSGKEMYANKGVIGLARAHEEYSFSWLLCEGYDGGFDDHYMTKAEKHELADYMIELWQEFKATIE